MLYNQPTSYCSPLSREHKNVARFTECFTGQAPTHFDKDYLDLPQTACKGNVYILTAQYFDTCVKYSLNVLGVDGTKQHNREELRFLESYGSRSEQVKIVNFREEKLIIINVTRKVIFVCNDKGEYLKTIDITAQLRKANNFCNFPIFTFLYNGRVVCCEGRRKLNVYSINEESSCLIKTTTIPVKHVVQTVAFNHQSDELIILCRALLLCEYYLLIYTEDGELKKDIKLQNGDYRAARLISHRNGRVVLLDNHKLFHLI